MKVRVLYNLDKSISVIYSAPKGRFPNELEEDWLRRVFDQSTPSGTDYEDIDSSELPQSRKDREFWRGEKGKGISIDVIAKSAHEEEEKIKEEEKSSLRAQAIQSLKDKGAIE